MIRKQAVPLLLLVLVLLFCATLGAWRASDHPVQHAAATIVEGETWPELPAHRLPEDARLAPAQPAVQRVEATGDAGAGTFQLELQAPPEGISRAFLVYELAGVPHWTATVRSINGLPLLGGFGAVRSSGTALQVEEINPRWLRAGMNQILFLPAPAAELMPSRVTNLRRQEAGAQAFGGVPYTVRNLRLMFVDGSAPSTPVLRLANPADGENNPAGTVLRGFVDPSGTPHGPAELFVNEVYVPQGIHPADGSFAVFVPRTAADGEAWEARIEVVYRDGTRIRHSVKLSRETSADDDGDESEEEAEIDVDPTSERSLRLGKARLDITPGALRGKVRVTMRGLRRDELPAMDAGMTNVTPERRGFRLGPHGLRFKKPVHLRLPYDAELIPKGMTAADVRTFFFDEEAGRWIVLPRVDVSTGGGEAEAQKDADVIVSATDHFTDFVNATLAVPDAPSGANHAPNSIQELAKGDPASEIVQIAPPEGGPTGDAQLDFPLVIPPGRQGMEPELAVRYNSGGGNSWLGVGWDLRLPVIEISTLFGVPRYNGTERYTIDGEPLAATSGGVYVRRAEGKFDRIVRHGSGPADYWWEVTDKNGTRYQYGRTAQARLRDGRSGNTFRWHLEREIDLHGNTVDYTYFTDQGADGEPWSEVYPARIDYTGLQGADAYYRVTFTLDAGNRPDRISSGRQGFKTYMRRRLASVDVLAGGEIVRRYVFAYREGDFQKSLLTSIAVKGEGGAADFYRHSFDYVRMATEGDGYAAFSREQAWRGMASGSDLTGSRRAGIGAHGFAGLGPVGCQPHGGVQLGGSDTDSTQNVSFLDVNGDGLPDRLDGSGEVDLNAYDPAADPDGSRSGRFTSTRFDNADTLGHTGEWSLDFGLGLHAEAGITARLDETWVWSHANDDRTIADLNGDFRPDLVSTDGEFAVRINDGSAFSTRSLWSGFGGEGLNLSSPGEEEEVMTKFPLSNALRQLVLPYAGRAIILGAVKKKEAGGDGVDVSIYHNGAAVWTRRFAAGDLAPCAPGAGNSCNGGLARDVRAGDSLYFLATSIRDTTADALQWSPLVTYEGRDVQAREPYGARTFMFNAASDFALAGYTGASWSAAASGTVRISGTLLKQETSDDVLVSVARGRGEKEETLFTRTFAAAEQASFDAFPTVAVGAGDVLFLRISTRTPIDPKRVQWTPTVSFEGATEPATLSDDIRSRHAQVSMLVPRLLPADEPTKSSTASASGQQTFKVTCDKDVSATFYVQGVNRLLARRATAEKFDVTVTATAGEPLFLTLLGGTSSPGRCKVDDGNTPLNTRWLDDKAAPSVLSGGHHGWYYGDWNGSVAFHPSLLVAPKSQKDDPPFTAGVPRWEGTKGFVQPVWLATGFDLFIAGEGMKPSRRGANAAGVLDQASGTTPGGGLSVLRKTSTKTVGVAVSAGVTLSLSHGESDTQLDLLDMNGDRYPDQVSGGGVRFSNGRDGFLGRQSFPGLDSVVRRSEDDNVSSSIGIGINFTKKNGQGKSTAVLSTLPSVGSAVSLSHVRKDLIDVNGDSLPDRVSMVPGSGAVSVQLNLGYRFGAPETWTLPTLSPTSTCTDRVDSVSSSIGSLSSLDTMNGLSFTRSSVLQGGVAIGPFGGGASTTLARTLVELIDVNGDGLADRVAKDEGNDYFRVQLNLGDRWDDEQRWYVPRWDSSIGGVYNVGGIFQCLDAVTFSGHIEVQGSVGAPVCIPLVPPVPVLGLQIEVSVQGFGSTSSGMQLFMQDLDGDGFADHVLKKAGDENVYVKRNQAAKVNLLKSVQRPLGSTIELAYERRGNHADMPFSQWVLSQVTVNDGRGSAPIVTRYHYDNDAYYDRNEREHYGFARVRATLPDGSTVERNFHNRDLYTRHLQTKEVLADASGNLFRVETKRYEPQAVAGSQLARFPALVSETTSFYEGTTPAEGNAPKSTSRTFEYDAFGNVVRTTDFADSGNDDDLATAIAWRIDPETHLTVPSGIEVRDGDGRLLRARQGTYSARGDLVRLEQTLAGGREPESGSAYAGSKNAVWSFTHDDVGNTITAADPTGFTTTISYDTATRTHAVEVRDSFGYVTRHSHDLKHGQVTETIDQNGNAIRRAYDRFGRIIRVVGPYDSEAAPTLSFEYGLGAPVSWAVVRHKDATRADTIDTAVFIDSLGRVLQTKEDAELDMGSGTSTRSGMRVSGRVVFDTKGRKVSEGQPIFDDRAASQFVDASAKNPTTFTYDALDRVRSARFPHGAVTRLDYNFAMLDGTRRFLTVRTDPTGRVTRFFRDVQDNVLGIEQTNSIAGAKKSLVTRYSYDALDQLLAVTDAKGNTTRLEYDTLGRIVVLNNPDAGRTEYRYDPNGNLRAKITANLAAVNQQIRYLYSYNRLDRIDYPQSPDVLYTYGEPGAPSNRANRVVTVADASGVEERSYGKLGEVVQTVKTTTALNGTSPKGPFTTRFQFDSFARLLSVVYPDGETLTYGYDAGGNVKSATGVLAGVRFEYLRHLGYDEFGAHARMLLGNGVETRYTHDPASRFLSALRTTAGGRDLQNLRYQYDLAGTMHALQNDVPVPAPSLYGGPMSQSFKYDDLAQLVGAQGTYRTGPNKTSTYALTLAYDELGNTTSKNQLHQTGTGEKLNVEKKTSYNAAYSYAGPQPHAATRIGERTFTYDLNGNQTGWTTDVNGTRRTMVWNEENRLASLSDNGQTTRFLYDANGTRSNKAGPHGETTYVNHWFSLRNGAVASKHVFADDLRVATKVSPDPEPPSEKVYFFQTDHLGSTNFVTDERATVFQHLEYFPSGETWVDERSETQRTPFLFSGKELDEETGLSYFGYRYYDPRQGQWISADPILDEMLDLRKLTPSQSGAAFDLPGHIYGYVGNDPLNHVDPDGLGKMHPNLVAGRKHERLVRNRLNKLTKNKVIRGFREQVPVRANGVNARLDFLVTTKKGRLIALEAKASKTAPKTKNQKFVFPLLTKQNFTLDGKNHAPLKKVSIVRDNTLKHESTLTKMVTD